MSYSLTYTVTASSRLEAIERAVALLRTDVRLRGVNRVDPVAGSGLWTVSLNVWEDA